METERIGSRVHKPVLYTDTGCHAEGEAYTRACIFKTVSRRLCAGLSKEMVSDFSVYVPDGHTESFLRQIGPPIAGPSLQTRSQLHELVVCRGVGLETGRISQRRVLRDSLWTQTWSLSGRPEQIFSSAYMFA